MEEQNSSGSLDARLSTEADKQYTTHGAACEWRGKDGIKRHSQITKSNKGNFRLEIQTWWDGEDNDPLVTTVCLCGETFGVLTELFMDFSLNMDRFKAPAQKPDNDGIERRAEGGCGPNVG